MIAQAADPNSDWLVIIKLLCASQAMFTAGVSAVVCYWYFYNWRRRSPRVGLLPTHVVAVSLAHSLLTIGAALGIYEDLDKPATLKFFLYVAGFIFTDVALITILRLQRRYRLRAQLPMVERRSNPYD